MIVFTTLRKMLRKNVTIWKVYAWGILGFQDLISGKIVPWEENVIYDGKGENPFWMFEDHPGVGIEF